jgi:hypothetical protein
MKNNAWIGKINMNEVISFNHAAQYAKLWMQLTHVQLESKVVDNITWKLSSNGEYMMAAAYKA